jgi:hypothetical protein
MKSKLHNVSKPDKKVIIKISDGEDDLYEFEISYVDVKMALNCYLKIIDGILILTDVDIEGPGQKYFGSKIHRVIDEVCREFCRMFNTKEIILIGSKRAVGRTKGSFLSPLHKKYSEL